VLKDVPHLPVTGPASLSSGSCPQTSMLGRSCGSCTWAHADGGEQGAYGGAINSVSSGTHGRVRRRRVHVLVERQGVELRQALVLVLASLVPEPHESEEINSHLSRPSRPTLDASGLT
jgi:hypothetical protein